MIEVSAKLVESSCRIPAEPSLARDGVLGQYDIRFLSIEIILLDICFSFSKWVHNTFEFTEPASSFDCLRGKYASPCSS